MKPQSLSSRFVRFGLGLLVFGVLAQGSASAQGIGAAAGAFQQLGAAAWIDRVHSLRSMGIAVPPAATMQDGYQEFYFPVPAGVPLDAAVINLKAQYLVAGNEGAVLQLLIDGKPVEARTITDKKGVLDISVPFPAITTASGFVRLGINWLPIAPPNWQLCQPPPASATTLTVNPETGLSYRYKSVAPLSLRSAWGAMASSPVLLVSGTAVGREEFNTGWRTATVLERAGKRVRVQAFPGPGEAVDTSSLSVPGGLQHIAAFAALSQRQPAHVLRDQAEIGALIVLGSPRVAGDVVIVSDALKKNFNEALDALGATLTGDAATAFQSWRATQSLLATGPAPADVSVARLGMGPVIAIDSKSGPAAATVLGDTWRALLLSDKVNVSMLAEPASGKNRIGLARLGGSFASFDVVNQGQWSNTFALDSVARDGLMPTKLVLDIAAAPDASGAKPIVSVSWNNVLLTADALRADGEKQRMTARIPGYALGLSNTLRVTVQRLPTAVGCATPPKGYPVNLLPTSYLETGEPEPDGTFTGLLPLLADSAELIVPEAWLEQGANRILHVSRLALASGLSAARTKLVLASAGKPVIPTSTFVALDSAVQSTKPLVQIGAGGQLKIGNKKAAWVDVAGLDNLIAIEVVASGGHNGLLRHSLGTEQPASLAPYVLERGNIAIVGPQGTVAMMDSAKPQSSSVRDETESAFYEWRHYISWGVPLVSALLLLFVVVLALAYRAGRRTRPGK